MSANCEVFTTSTTASASSPTNTSPRWSEREARPPPISTFGTSAASSPFFAAFPSLPAPCSFSVGETPVPFRPDAQLDRRLALGAEHELLGRRRLAPRAEANLSAVPLGGTVGSALRSENGPVGSSASARSGSGYGSRERSVTARITN